MYLCSILLYALYLLNYWFVGLQGKVFRKESTHKFSTVFLLKGKDLLLELKKPIPGGGFLWRFNASINIIKHHPRGLTENFFEERAEFSTKNYSLRLKNLGWNDSGLYQAVDSGSKDIVIAEYHVTVQEQVSPVVLNVSSVSPSPESCNVTVTCNTQGHSLKSTFTFTHQTCSKDGGVSSEVVTTAVPLHVYLSHDFIVICNHSNKVSWSKEKLEIKPMCLKGAGINCITNLTRQLITTAICLLIFIIVLCFLCICYKWRKKNKCEIHSPGSDDQSPTCDQSPTVYSLLEIPLQPIHPGTASPEELGDPSLSSTLSRPGTDVGPGFPLVEPFPPQPQRNWGPPGGRGRTGTDGDGWGRTGTDGRTTFLCLT